MCVRAGGASVANKNERALQATTYGSLVDSGRMSCSFVKGVCSRASCFEARKLANNLQVRDLIVAVAAFTNSKVDVVGYSMGGPISRKAILGGRCVDTGAFRDQATSLFLKVGCRREPRRAADQSRLRVFERRRLSANAICMWAKVRWRVRLRISQRHQRS